MIIAPTEVLLLLLIGILILTTVVYALIVPLIISFSAERDEKNLLFTSTFSWGLTSICLSQELDRRVISFLIFNHFIYRKIERTPFRRPRKPLSSKLWETQRIKITLFNLFKILPYFNIFLGKLIKAVRIRSIACDAKIGFPSASTTGIVFGYFLAIKSILTPFRQISLKVIPFFDRTIFEGRFSLQIEIRHPIIVTAHLIQFLLSKPVRNVFWVRA